MLRFFLATGIATAVSAVGGAAGFALFKPSEATALATWLHWLAADASGVIAVAPLMIGLVRSWRDRPELSQAVEGVGILAVLAVASLLGFVWMTDHWFTILPLAVLLPLLVWPAARCPPAFAAAAVLILALVMVATLASGIGRLGDPAVPLSHRLLAAQSALLAAAICTLVVAALFAERRSGEALLGDSYQRLRTQEEAFRRLLGSLPAAIYTTDKSGRITYCNPAAVELWGMRPELGKEKWADLWRLHYPDGTSMPLDQRPTQIALSEGRTVRGREALLERPDGTQVPIMPCPAPLRDDRGTVIGVVNMQVDLTERKRAQAALAERDTLLTLASKVARVGSYTLDCITGVLQMSPGCAALYGLPEGATELSQAEARACVLAEDLAALDAQFARACTRQQCEVVTQFRVVRVSDGEVRWIETRNLVSYDAGRPSRIVGIGIDVTERKRAEEHQRMLIAELDHRVKNVLATVNAVASRTQDTSRSGADFVAALAGRIQSMAATHELLSCRQWKGVSIRELVRRELAPYMTARNTDLDGPEMMLSPESAQALSMVLHELTTNAAKHGALATDAGRVGVHWHAATGRSGDACVRIEWREAGGPAVHPAQRSGYGTDIIRGLIPHELDGAVDLAFAVEGVRCDIDIPLATLRGEQAASPCGRAPASALASPEIS